MIVDCGALMVSGRLSLLPSTEATPAPSANALPPCTKAFAGLASSAAQAHALPLHLAISLAAQAVVGNSWFAVKPIVPVVLIGPPVRPAPVATLVTVPPVAPQPASRMLCTAAGGCACRCRAKQCRWSAPRR